MIVYGPQYAVNRARRIIYGPLGIVSGSGEVSGEMWKECRV